jgi:short-subunit dehydrogenase
MKPLDYKNALVTGASSGLGRGLALWLAKRGIRIHAAARRGEQLRALADEAKAAGGDVEPVSMDVVDTEATVKTLQRIDDACGGLDLVIANAGLGADMSKDRFGWESVEKTLRVNVMGAAATLTAVLPRMVERGRGHLVGMSSLAAYRGLPRAATYSGSKAFLHTFLEGIRVDLKRKGIRVTSIHPGFVKTEMTANSKMPLPFLMDLDAAVERMGRAILRADSEFAFPWQMSTAISLAKLLPNGLYDVAAKRLM